ncbi:hypothetical protein NHX12_007137 [Muraenolepis orangiensis]|uniref:Uncharacterized protein n=1 Tax=Muraenolepis orangiensis TaxID=630683 RepID=A0A9Q0DSU3_9TELE|nr:hypothetical protein NHX12_007137 [Muraenolepis orangiensis]
MIGTLSTTVRYGPSVPPYAMAPQYHRTLWPLSTTVRYGPSVPPYAMALSTTVRYGPSVPPYAMALSTTVRYGPSVPPYAMAPRLFPRSLSKCHAMAPTLWAWIYSQAWALHYWMVPDKSSKSPSLRHGNDGPPCSLD